MGTKSTVVYEFNEARRAKLHLYEELLESVLYLEVTEGPFSLTLQLPPSWVAALLADPRSTRYAATGSTEQ